jgi:hypothetical protein
MKNAYPLVDVSRRKPTKRKKQKLAGTTDKHNIEQRYKELLRLRAIIYEAEAARDVR